MANSRSSSSSCRTMPSLPAGFRFHPTDEELIVHYLMNQAACVPCPVPIIAEVNIYECNPWDLPRKAVFGENEWYFFSPRDRKYPNGSRPNRAAGNGYWKATGTDKAVVAAASTGETVGVKKALVFYMGRPPRGVKTDWIMHEYRLTVGNGKTTRRAAGSSSSSSSMRLDDWVLCRIHKKSNNFQFSDQEQEGSSIVEEADSSLNNTNMNSNGGAPSPASEQASHASDAGDHQFQLPPHLPKSCSLTDLLNTIDCSVLSQLLLDAPAEPEPEPQPQPQQQGQSPLIYYATPACPQPLLLKSSLNGSQLQVDALFSDYSAGYYSRSSGLKRKRSSCDDGSSSRRKLQLLPSEATFFGSASGHCNQQLAEAASSSGGGFQYSGLLSHPLLNQQQLLLNGHLEMQMQ